MTEEKDAQPKGDEWKLPPVFEEKREDYYILHSRLNQAIANGDNNTRDNTLIQYLERIDYLTNRILPKLRFQDATDAVDIQRYSRTYMKDYGKDPDKGITQLNINHLRLSEILFAYNFDKITPTILSL